MREKVYGRYRRWDSSEMSERIEGENGFGWYILRLMKVMA